MAKNPVRVLLFYIAYFAIACVVGGLVTMIAPAPFTSGLAFGAIMGAVMLGCRQLERVLDSRSASATAMRSQLGTFMLLYVGVPAAIAYIVHLFFPALIVLGAPLEIFLGLMWMPVFLASLLQFKSKIC